MKSGDLLMETIIGKLLTQEKGGWKVTLFIKRGDTMVKSGELFVIKLSCFSRRQSQQNSLISVLNPQSWLLTHGKIFLC